MIRLTLSDDEVAAVRALRRDPTLAPAERDRVEMVLLSVAGWPPPAIAVHLGYCAATVRTVLKAFAQTGATGLRRKRSGPPKDAARRRQVTTALDRLLGQDRTWTAAQLAAALGDEGIALSPRQTRKYLKGMDATWRRLRRSCPPRTRTSSATATPAAPRSVRPLAEDGRDADADRSVGRAETGDPLPEPNLPFGAGDA